jgi:hypothetical protein
MRATESMHLTDDHFVDCAAGLGISPEAEEHLRECAACREELAGFGVAVDSFVSASLHWSEARPVPTLRDRVRAHRPVLAWAAVAVAACIMLVFGVNAALHHGEVGKQQVAANVALAERGDSEAQIAQDNKLLMAVDEALRDDEPSPIEVYALERIASERAAKGQGAEGNGKVTNQ